MFFSVTPDNVNFVLKIMVRRQQELLERREAEQGEVGKAREENDRRERAGKKECME